MAVCEAVLCDGDGCVAYAVLDSPDAQEGFSAVGWSFELESPMGRRDLCILCTAREVA